MHVTLDLNRVPVPHWRQVCGTRRVHLVTTFTSPKTLLFDPISIPNFSLHPSIRPLYSLHSSNHLAPPHISQTYFSTNSRSPQKTCSSMATHSPNLSPPVSLVVDSNNQSQYTLMSMVFGTTTKSKHFNADKPKEALTFTSAMYGGNRRIYNI